MKHPTVTTTTPDPKPISTSSSTAPPPAWRRASALPYQRLDEEVLVVDPRTRSVHLLNPTATRVWELLQSTTTQSRLLELLCAEFEAPPDAIRTDLERLLGDLSAKGLIGREDDGYDAGHRAGPA
jgi:PqqD family protein of HPr-rel-A system